MPERMDPDAWRRSKIRSEWRCDLCGEHMLNDRCPHGLPMFSLENGRVVWTRMGVKA